MSAYDMMNEKKKPVYPTIDEGTYAEDVERGIAEAEKKAAEIERQAKRDRDMALIGDMAHLVSQGAAMHGGAWKIGQTQNESAKGNERLRVLREKNAAQTAAFAKERAALREAKRKEENARKLAAYEAERDAYKDAIAQAKDKRDYEEKVRHNQEIEKYQRAREQRLGAQGSGSSSSVNRDVYLLNDDGTKEYFKHADDANNVQAAYARLPKKYRVEKAVPRTETIRGRKVYVKDSEGKQVYDYMEDIDASLEQKRQAISDYNNRYLVEDPDADLVVDSTDYSQYKRK